ncbi:carbohydrate ABC transporter permease [Janthinobacterium violaceinigrum]|uniref:Sugar ABC transporter permease n=1 Tax=Janthinobacterium violaceinigrum TaxID=2654252 RepID=A0A6I1I305_9BURK|nr:sugar ABC transporter permease [Janthinobacterium violaceinigrum]KAB8065253.1 sugar ABC transporter permease [Janthinobacterium violaceinigrum]
MSSNVLAAGAVPAGARASRPVRWHIGVLLAPALLIYTAVMVIPLAETLRLAFFRLAGDRQEYAGLANFMRLFGEGNWSQQFWNALLNNSYFFLMHLLIMVPLAIVLAALLSLPRMRASGFYRTALFMPTLLSFVVVGFVWKLILSPLWGVAPSLLDLVGLKSLFAPYLGREASALTTLGFISIWQYVGMPMMLSYAAMLSIPNEIIEAAEIDGVVGIAQFLQIKLPLLWPTIGMISILTFVANFNSFDLIYTAQGALAGPNYSTDILGTLLYRTFFGAQLQLGDPNMGATIATMMLLIILGIVCAFLFFVQRKLTRYQL